MLSHRYPSRDPSIPEAQQRDPVTVSPAHRWQRDAHDTRLESLPHSDNLPQPPLVLRHHAPTALSRQPFNMLGQLLVDSGKELARIESWAARDALASVDDCMIRQRGRFAR